MVQKRPTVPMSFFAVAVRVRGFDLHCVLRPRGRRKISMGPRIVRWRLTTGRDTAWHTDTKVLPLSGETKRQVLARVAIILRKFNVAEAP